MAASSSFYFHLSFYLYVWVLSATALTIIPHFSSHYNEIIAAALFFPMWFATIGTLFAGRFIIRMAHYLIGRRRWTSSQKIEEWDRWNIKEVEHGVSSGSMIQNLRRKRIKYPKMVTFHRPFRKLVKSSAFLSASLSLLYAHCWSRTLSAFKVSAVDGAGAVCRAVFSPFQRNEFNSSGVDEIYIWIFWTLGVAIMLMTYAQDEFAGLHIDQSADYISTLRADSGLPGTDSSSDLHSMRMDNCNMKSSNPAEMNDSSDFSTSLRSAAQAALFSRHHDRPKDVLPMVSF